MRWMLENTDNLELIMIRKFNLKKDCLKELLKDNNTYKENVLNILNGFEDKNSEEYLRSYKDIKELMESFNLDIEKIYFEESLDERFIFYIGPLVYLYRGFIIMITYNTNIKELMTNIKRVCDSLDDFFIEGKPLSSRIMFSCPQRYTITLFNIFSYAMTKEDRISMGKNLYFSNDYGANNISQELIEEIFSENNNLNDLPSGDYITIYRGVGSKSTPLEEAYAWTTDIEVAKFFATRFLKIEKDLDKVKVYKLKIHKDHIMHYEGGHEKEVIVNTDNIIDYLECSLIEEVDFDKSRQYYMPNRQDTSQGVENDKEEDTSQNIENNKEEDEEEIIISPKLIEALNE